MATTHSPSANYIPPGHAKSNADDNADVVLWADPTTHRLLVDALTEFPTAAALGDNTTNPTAPAVGSFPHWYDGSTWDRAKGDSTDGLLVNLGINNDVSLNAGTNAIGKLAANSGVDIGDVDVTSIANGSLNGPGAPVIDSYTHAAISAVTGANQSIVGTPGASKQIWVYGLVFTTTVAGTVAIQDEDDTVISGAMNFAQYSGIDSPPSGNFAMPMFKVATNKALEMDVTTATINGIIWYAVVSV